MAIQASECKIDGVRPKKGLSFSRNERRYLMSRKLHKVLDDFFHTKSHRVKFDAFYRWY